MGNYLKIKNDDINVLKENISNNDKVNNKLMNDIVKSLETIEKLKIYHIKDTKFYNSSNLTPHFSFKNKEDQGKEEYLKEMIYKLEKELELETIKGNLWQSI